MSSTYCCGCGGRLRDAIFCPWCGECLCSCRCVDRHLVQHLALTRNDPVTTATASEPVTDANATDD